MGSALAEGTPTLRRRFWAKVVKGPGCWGWTGSVQSRGYAVISVSEERGDNRPAHRLSWELHYGSIPDGVFVLHHCDNRTCTRPDHLFLGTAKDNTADMFAKGRQGDTGLVGERNGRAKLTEDDVRTIRREYVKDGVTPRRLATRFGVTPTTIHWTAQGRNWSHVV